MTDSERRRTALAHGARAEWLAMGFLMLKGYRPVARNVGGKGGEIDLIMRRRGLIIFVEVKARNDAATALWSVTPAKTRLIGKAARYWLTRNPWAHALSLRGDIVAVTGWKKPTHVEGAFEV
ncbi:MAG: YraN family protein [Bosea sp. (in: a-proteobacteria)]